MNTVPISGTSRSVSYYPDDSVEIVRQLLALEVESHPDRLFVEVNTTLPADYYDNPQHWMELFFRLSYDGQSVTEDALKTYVTQTRMGTGFTPRAVSKEEWERRLDLELLFKSEADFSEWRVLGVPQEQSVVLPLPPRDVSLRASQIPIPRPQRLMEVLHPDPITEIRATEVQEDLSTIVKQVYFPLLRPDTPSTIESIRPALQKARSEFAKLLALPATKHESAVIVKAKWYIPLVTTRISAPRVRFEQILYGMTVSEDTPHIAYFTAKNETVRHKFFTKDPKTKTPALSPALVKNWYHKTQPQRRRPTLLLYRGDGPTHFDRIAVTDMDIVVDVRREKSSKKSLDDLQKEMVKWMKTLDALLPFVNESDLDVSRWKLSELSLVATYAKEIGEQDVDMRRFPCMQSIFGIQDEMFRVLRTDQPGASIPPQILQAYQILNQEGSLKTPEYLAEELGISTTEAQERMTAIEQMSDDVNFEQMLRTYPTLKFHSKEVIIRFVTNPERMLKYADLLRYVLTTNSEAVNEVCPRRLEEFVPQMVIPQQAIQEDDVDVDLNMLALLEEGEAPVAVEEEPVSNAAPPPKARKLKIAKKLKSTQTYFNDRLKENYPDTFDQSFYPKKCEKRQQVVVLSSEDQARIPAEYNYSTAEESEKLALETGDGIAICPPYWCMRDELPLREEQLAAGEDGDKQCPVCGGKIRTSDTDDPAVFTLIRRDTAMKYPDFMKKESTINKKKVPCCYLQPRSQTEILVKDEELYILREDVNLDTGIPGLRFAYLSEDLATKLKVTPKYETTVKKNYLIFGESDVFRIGLGRASKTLPTLFGEPNAKIPEPKDAVANLMKCSFFRTWAQTQEGGGTQVERMVASIQSAYELGTLTKLQELEYVTTVLQCEVILIDPVSSQVSCGFWSDTVGPNSRTIAIIGNDILGLVRRKRVGKNYKTEFTVDLRKPPFVDTTLPHLQGLHRQACSVGVPTLDDAVAELQRMGKPSYQRILDPYGRIQAILVPGEVILPVLPSAKPTTAGVQTREGYADLKASDIPDGASERAILAECRHPGFKVVADHRNLDGEIVELQLASGFRVPIKAEAAKSAGPAMEVVETIQTHNENTLVDGTPNKADIAMAEETSYAAEIYEFLLFSLSKDLQTDEYATLRKHVVERASTLYQDLKAWVKAEAYEDNTKSPVAFVNKVRTPCGQYTSADTCNKSTLCGWHNNDCRIRVKPIVKLEDILKRMVKTLRDNDKQRALVLDARLSPFFSTVLYLELPHEVILTSL